jgi:ArsR family metal-binding transcriptional regulator
VVLRPIQYTRKDVQVVTDLQTSCDKVVVKPIYQDVFALLVPSCCDKCGTSCYHLVTRLMMVTDLRQVVPTGLIQAVFVTSCYELVVIDFGTSCKPC